MEVGDHTVDDSVGISRCDDDACRGIEGCLAESVEIIDECFECFFAAEFGVYAVVGLPLGNFAVPVSGFDENSDMIKAFKRSDRCRADSDNRVGCGRESRDGVASDGNKFTVHVMTADIFGFDGLECAGADVESDFAACDAAAVDLFEQPGCEVQSGGRCGDRTVDAAEDSLIVTAVALFGVAVEVGRYGYLAGRGYDVGKCK